RLITEHDEHRRRPRLERTDTCRDRGALPVLRMRIYGVANAEPCQRRADGVVVVARHHEAVVDVRQHRTDAPADDRLALAVEEKLLAAHGAGEPGGEHDRSDHRVKAAARVTELSEMRVAPWQAPPHCR